MNKIKLGILLGLVAGIIDIIPMIIQKLSWGANLSAFTHWIIVGFLIASSNLKLKGIAKGLLISIITLIPLAFLVWWNDYSSILPISISTLIYGATLGFLINKYGQ